jgi:hypothetical protein
MKQLTLIIISILICCYCQQEDIIWSKRRNIDFPGLMRLANEGVSHDDKYFYFSNQHLFYKTTITPPIEIIETKEGIPSELLKLKYNHIGDFDVDSVNGILYGGIEMSGHQPNGIIGAWNTTDFSLIRYKVTTQAGIPWVAVDFKSKLIYSCVWNSQSLLMYDLDTFDFIKQLDLIPSNIDIGIPKEIQGASFYNNDLYITSNTNCSVYKINISTGITTFVLSDETYKYHEYEMEGITFFDNDELKKQGYGTMMIYGNFMSLQKSLHTFTPEEIIISSSSNSNSFTSSSGTCSCSQYGGGSCSGICSGSSCPCMNCEIVHQTC